MGKEYKKCGRRSILVADDIADGLVIIGEEKCRQLMRAHMTMEKQKCVRWLEKTNSIGA